MKSKRDWHDIHRRLEAARRAVVERSVSADPEETRRILKERARALSRGREPGEGLQDGFEVVEFVLAHEKYAVESRFVREVCPLKDLTPLPCTPEFVLGVVNVRGQILSVIDIKRFFDLPHRGLTDLDKVVILRSDSMELGILADVITGTRIVSTAELQASLPTLTGIREEYLKGVTADRAVVLDGGRLLSDRSIVVHEQVNT
jgi:purine-binding chemotaxis protein CheW